MVEAVLPTPQALRVALPRLTLPFANPARPADYAVTTQRARRHMDLQRYGLCQPGEAKHHVAFQLMYLWLDFTHFKQPNHIFTFTDSI